MTALAPLFQEQSLAMMSCPQRYF